MLAGHIAFRVNVEQYNIGLMRNTRRKFHIRQHHRVNNFIIIRKIFQSVFTVYVFIVK